MSPRDSDHFHPGCNAAFGAAAFVGATTAIVAFASLTGVQPVPGMTVNLLALIDALLFASVAWGIRRHSRLAALAGLALFGLEKLMAPPPSSLIAWGVAVGLIACFTAGVVGVFAHHRLREEAPTAIPA